MTDTLPIVNERQVQVNKPDSINIEELIKNTVESIQKLSDELKQKREMFTDSFINNPSYRERDQQVKDASKARNSVKAEIAKAPSVASLEQEVKDLRFDIRDRKQTLSDLLLDFKLQTGATQLELFSGEMVEIVESAKIVRARK